LLDIDFDGAVPASLQGQTSSSSGLANLVGDTATTGSRATGPSNTMDDLMGIFGGPPNTSTAASGGTDDLMNGFGGLDLSGSNQQQPAEQKRTNEDIMGLF